MAPPPPRKRQRLSQPADTRPIELDEDSSNSVSGEDEQEQQHQQQEGNREQQQQRQAVDEDSASEVDEAEDPNLAQISEDAAPAKGFLHASRGEAYLHAVARPSKTSANKLSSSFDEPFTKTSYQAALHGYDQDPTRQAHLQRLREIYRARYALWKAELLQGHSLLFHGVGSKRTLLNAFAREALAKVGPVVVANAFASGVAVTDILAEMERVLGLSNASASGSTTATMSAAAATVEAGVAADKNLIRARSLCRHLERFSGSKRVVLLVHNIDAPTFRSAKVKALLATLAACPFIHLAASVDHVKAMLLFPSAMVGSYPIASSPTSSSNMPGEPTTTSAHQDRGFAFLHHHTPTFEPYTQETLQSGTTSSLFPPEIFPSLAASTSNSNSAKMASTLAVLASLQTNAKELFKHLAQLQLSRIPASLAADPTNASASSDRSRAAAAAAVSAVTYDELLDSCKRNFWANNESQMESLLLEFRDHDIVKGGSEHPAGVTAPDGGGPQEAGSNGWLWIAMGKTALEGVLERME